MPITRTVRAIPTEVALGPEDGMPVDCVLSVDNLTVIRLSLCTARITSLGPSRLAAVGKALRVATRC